MKTREISEKRVRDQQISHGFRKDERGRLENKSEQER